jgi:small GTP-binding protein
MAKKLPVVAIVGRANVGKSSIFNRALERQESIVAREAGTTRDAVYRTIEYGKHHFWLVDTAGLKDPEDEFEATIQDQIEEAADAADMYYSRRRSAYRHKRRRPPSCQKSTTKQKTSNFSHKQSRPNS